MDQFRCLLCDAILEKSLYELPATSYRCPSCKAMFPEKRLYVRMFAEEIFGREPQKIRIVTLLRHAVEFLGLSDAIMVADALLAERSKYDAAASVGVEP